MKYDIMKAFRAYLNSSFNKNTADRYYYAVNKLLIGKHINTVKDIEIDFLKERLSNIKNKNDFSAAKNGLIQLKKVFPMLSIPNEDFFKIHGLEKRNWTKKRRKVLYFDEIRRKVSGIRNEKLKYAFRLMLASGLRVSETAALTKDDITIDGDEISINVLHGKGGSNGLVKCQPDKYLSDRLPTYLEKKEGAEKLFYSANTMKKKAGELGVECHDLRRIAAITYRNANIKDVGAYEANKRVKSMLRHERFSTTKRYLFNRKLKIRRRKGDGNGK